MLDMTPSRSRRLFAAAALIACLALTGCAETPPSGTPTPLSSAAQAAANSTTAPEASTPLAPIAATVETPQQVNEKSDPKALTPTPAEGVPQMSIVAEYKPPFPDRVELFVPPKRQGGLMLKEGESEDAVELLGFVRLDRQKVVLSINGQVTPIAEGASEYGIEVISIQPPNVVLQRGRQRWQASLEN
jgi:hypothetical protein